MNTIQQRILTILKERGAATVFDMAEDLELAPVSVRHHLDMLLRQELICTDGVHRRKTRGRPRHIYVLTDAASRFFPHGYEALARELLKEIKHSLPSAQVAAFFQRLAAEAANELPIEQGACLEERLAAVARFLSDKGYLANWEPQDGGAYALHVFNCPFAGLPEEHDELCRMDLMLISTLLQRPARRIAHAAAGDHRCTYLIE